MFKTVRQLAKSGVAPEHFIRRLIAVGKCPGVYSGNRFLVNEEQFLELLNQMSREGKEGMAHE